MWLAVSHHLALSSAAAGAAALVLLGQRLAFAGQSAGMLQESAMFIDDFLAFTEQAPRMESRQAGSPEAGGSVRSDRGEGGDVQLPGVGTSRAARRLVAHRARRGGRAGGGQRLGQDHAGQAAGGAVPAQPGADLLGRAGHAGRGPPRPAGHTAMVFQDFIQYALSAGDNIALGRHERAGDTAAIVQAAEQAGADKDIAGLPEGYETLLGPAFIDGTDLSTGQWQRVALARTFFRDAPLVILDEPTAALDAKAEHELFARIGELFADRSVLLISHRFSTVRSADRIYVLNEGCLVESGTHEQLVAADGTYAELFSLQASPYQ